MLLKRHMMRMCDPSKAIQQVVMKFSSVTSEQDKALENRNVYTNHMEHVATQHKYQITLHQQLYIGLSPFPLIVTTRIITCFVGGIL